jgi:hypothetical protein
LLEPLPSLEDLQDEWVFLLDHGFELIGGVAKRFDGKVLVVQLQHPEDPLVEALGKLTNQNQVYVTAFMDLARRERTKEVHLLEGKSLLEASDESL